MENHHICYNLSDIFITGGCWLVQVCRWSWFCCRLQDFASYS